MTCWSDLYISNRKPDLPDEVRAERGGMMSEVVDELSRYLKRKDQLGSIQHTDHSRSNGNALKGFSLRLALSEVCLVQCYSQIDSLPFSTYFIAHSTQKCKLILKRHNKKWKKGWENITWDIPKSITNYFYITPRHPLLPI